MEQKQPIFLGDIPTFEVGMDPIGELHLADVDWRVVYYTRNGKYEIPRSKATKVDDDTFLVDLPTVKVGVGKLLGVLFPKIPTSKTEEGFYEPPIPFDPDETIISLWGAR